MRMHEAQLISQASTPGHSAVFMKGDRVRTSGDSVLSLQLSCKSKILSKYKDFFKEH